MFSLQLIVLFVYSRIPYVLNEDPCNSYLSTNDTTMSVAYTLTDLNNNGTCQKKLSLFRWYRYTGTDSGNMINRCPKDLQCGSHAQVWYNDHVPTVDEGESLKDVCIRAGNSCCAAKSQLKAKNCTDFIIYFIIPVHTFCASYCYEARNDDRSLYFHKELNDYDDVPSWIWIIVSVGSVLSFIGLIAFVRYYLKRRNRLQTESSGQANLPSLHYRDPQIKRLFFNSTALKNT